MSDKNGGPAFPNESHLYSEQRLGMSLRDYFAAKAMQGIFSNEPQLLRYGKVATESGTTTMQIISEAAYMQADAMLAERAK